jgi:hypothetical protein
MLEKIKQLNVLDDKSWTSDGLPAISAVKAITGDESITRADINKVAFGLTRENVKTWIPNEPKTETAVEAVPVAPAVPELPLTELEAEIQALRDKSESLQRDINLATLQLHETDAQLKTLEAKLPNQADPNHYAIGYADYMASVQANKEAAIANGTYQPAPIDMIRRRHLNGRRYR